MQVGNIYRNNTVEYHPHACFVGGGDFEDGVGNLFESNTLHVCAFETLDAGERPRLQSVASPSDSGDAFRGLLFVGPARQRVH